MRLTELAQFLVNKGVGTAGRTLVTGFLPDKPNEVVAILETGGVQPSIAFTSTSVTYEQPAFQIQARSTSYQRARDLAQQAHDALWGIQNSTLSYSGSDSGKATRSTGIWLVCHPTQSPFLLERDSQKRVVIAFNCEAKVIP